MFFCGIGTGRDFYYFIFFNIYIYIYCIYIFLGVGQERFESLFLCHPLVWICYYNSNELTFKS